MRKEKHYSVEGNSLLLNILFIVLNFVGLTFLVLGYHPSMEAQATLFKLIGYSVLLLTIIFLFVFKGFYLFSFVSRILVGGLFIVSGLIKANDPKGFAYKLEEYFEDGALAFRIKDWLHWDTFSLEFIIDYALIISAVICIIEILLGVLVLLGVKIRTSSWALLLMMIFFTFLTWHTKECKPDTKFKDVDNYALDSNIAQVKLKQAETNENITILKQTDKIVSVQEIKDVQCVSDCGCFGDAMKGSVGRSLTPAESYWKDIVLFYLILIIFAVNYKIKLNTAKENIIMIIGGTIVITFFSYVFSWYFPLVFGLISMVLALWMKRIGGKIFGNSVGMILVVTLLCTGFVSYVLMYLPVKDYLPYHIGANLEENMTNGKEGIYQNIMIYRHLETQRDTSITEFNDATKPIWGDSETWEFKSRETKVIVPTIPPSIQQFEPAIRVADLTDVEKDFEPISLLLEEYKVPYVDLIDKSDNQKYPILLDDIDVNDLDTSRYILGDTLFRINEEFDEINLKEYILQQDRIFILFSRYLKNGDFRKLDNIKGIIEKAKENNIAFLLITSSGSEDIKTFREKTGLIVPTLQNDEIEIKAITRSNPTLMILEKAVVKGKYPYRSIPSWQWITTNIIKTEK